MGNFVKESQRISVTLWWWMLLCWETTNVRLHLWESAALCEFKPSYRLETHEKWPKRSDFNLVFVSYFNLLHLLLYFPPFTSQLISDCICSSASLCALCVKSFSYCVVYVLSGHCSVSCWTPDLFHIKGRISQAPASFPVIGSQIHWFYSGFLFLRLLIILKMETQQCFNCEQSWC